MSSPLGLLETFKKSYTKNDKKAYESIFNHNKFYYRPISVSESGNPNKSLKKDSKSNKTITNTDIYDISLSSIISYCKNIKSMQLKPSDFMYLRDLGLYPNNRLIICRRFRTGVENDLAVSKQEPISTIVSWIPEGSKMMEFSFGETWGEAQTKDPIALFDDIFKSALGSTVGGGFSGVGNAATTIAPLKGVSDALQFKLLDMLGVKSDAKYDNLPSGNPNFITEARQRGVLTSDISFDVETVYEQKFFGKLDPSVIFLDLINNILRFGSSESVFYITGAAPGSQIEKIADLFSSGAWAEGAGLLIGSFVSAIKGLVNKIGKSINTAMTAAKNMFYAKNKEQEELDKKATDSKNKLEKEQGLEPLQNQKNAVDGFKKIIDGALNTLGTIVISLYRIQIASVISVMTGRASTPWHITIGNPKKPIFSSGDMYISKSITVELGDVLAYNDLPYSVKVKFTLSSARALGIQEIFERFNVGGARVYNKLAYQQDPDFMDFFERPVAGATTSATTSFSKGFNDGGGNK